MTPASTTPCSRAAAELVVEVGYADLTVAAIAERAGTSKPAIYRRWPSKAHLVHEAAFPADGDAARRCPTPGRWPTTCAEMLRRTSRGVRRPGRTRRDRPA